MMLLLISIGAIAKDIKVPQYDITGAGSGSEGTILVKVYVYAKKVTDADLKRAAVHGVVFRGCTGNSSGAYQPAMAAPTVETENAAFCEEFFATDGECQNYASIVAGSYDRVKTKKGYKSGAILQVNKTTLRKELEKAGIIRSLSSGF
ncbi:MAG: hypothetical protein IJZ45_02625 [Bacteroidaceae bacterium]|nr:hypothetical protein [Bacteroidaceae bacterium]